MTSIRRAAITLVLGVGLATPLGGRQQPAAPMNVVVLVIDDTRWDSIGAAGNRIVRTPHLDRLASEGVHFRQARVTTSICMTSRASLLTGQYMSRHGIDRFGKPIMPEAFAKTYPGMLRAGGYWTGYVGKYDVGAPRPDDFDFVRAYQGRHWLTTASGERVHVTEQNALDSLDFLRSRPRERPFLLSVGYFAAHAEDQAKEQYLPQDWSAAGYEGARVPPSPLGDPKFLRALPPFLSSEANEGRVRYHWRFDTPESYQAYMLRYYRLITEVDAAVGRLVDELKAQGVYENTLIVFIGDNGYFHADRGLADKWYPYEQALRVPLIVRDPRLPAQQRGTTRDQIRAEHRRGANGPLRGGRGRTRGDAGARPRASLSLANAPGLARRVLLRAPDHHLTRADSGLAGGDRAGLEIRQLAGVSLRATVRPERGSAGVPESRRRTATAGCARGDAKEARGVARPGAVARPGLSLARAGQPQSRARTNS